MSGLFKYLWPLSSLEDASTAIPQYIQGEHEDSVVLQIKSLIYMFRSCNIASSKPFHTLPPGAVESVICTDIGRPSNENELTNNISSDSNLSRQQKLDIMYNRKEFERILTHDKHRVLVDWIKNKFRSLCILSERPEEIYGELPLFGAPNYKFVILNAVAPDSDYIKTLSESDIYVEQCVSMEVRHEIASEAVESVRSRSNSSFDKNDRARVIAKFLTNLAIQVQVDRLVKGALREQLKQTGRPIISPKKSSVSVPKLASYDRSPDRSPERWQERPFEPTSPVSIPSPLFMQSPEKPRFYLKIPDSNPDLATPNLPRPSSQSSRSRSMSPSRSSDLSSDSKSTSPVRTHKLLKKGSAINLSSSFGGSNIIPVLPSSSPAKDLSEDLRRDLVAQARMAVASRLQREKEVLARNT